MSLVGELGMAWQKLDTDTLTGVAASITLSGFIAKIFNQYLCHSFDGGTAGTLFKLTFNANSNTVYAHRFSDNGGAESTAVSQVLIPLGLNTFRDHFQMLYAISVSGEEKLVIGFVISAGVAGASTAPDRREIVAKFVPSPDADITQVKMLGDDDAGIGSNLSALGTD